MKQRLLKTAKWLVAFLAALTVLLILAVVLIGVLANTPTGREQILQTISSLTDGKVLVSELTGRFPDQLAVKQIELKDSASSWLVIKQLKLDWYPTRLILGLLDIQNLEAEHIAILHKPLTSEPAPKESSDKGFSLPIDVNLQTLKINQLSITEAVAGINADLSIAGHATVTAPNLANVDLGIQRLDQVGHYVLKGWLDPEKMNMHLAAEEPAGGLIASLAKLPELGQLNLSVDLQGPLDAIKTQLKLRAGEFKADANGTLDIEKNQADLAIHAYADAMRPRVDIEWQKISLNARVQGEFTKPAINGDLQIDALKAAGVSVKKINLNSQASIQQAQVHAQLDELILPGLKPELTSKNPVMIQANIQLDDKNYPLNVEIQHPLLKVDGKLLVVGEQKGDIILSLPDIKTLADIAGLKVAGDAKLKLNFQVKKQSTDLNVDGRLALTSAEKSLMNLLGKTTAFSTSLNIQQGENIKLSSMRIEGKNLNCASSGHYLTQNINLDWSCALPNLNALAEQVSGQMLMKGHLDGRPDNLGGIVNIQGELATKDLPRGPVTAKLQLQNLPAAPLADLTVQGQFAKAPLNLSISARPLKDKNLEIFIKRAAWKSLQAQGNLLIAQDTKQPLGKIDLTMTRLDDLRPVINQPIAGSVNAHAQFLTKGAKLQLEAHQLDLNNSLAIADTRLMVSVDELVQDPQLQGKLTLQGIATNGLDGSSQIDFSGHLDKVKLLVAAKLLNKDDKALQFNTAANINIPGGSIQLSQLKTDFAGETLKLLEPTQIDYKSGVRIHPTSIGLRQSILNLQGQISPTLALTVDLKALPINLLKHFVPQLALDGTLNADAQLTGNPSRPKGSAHFSTENLRLTRGNNINLPPAQLTGKAELNGDSVTLETHLKAGAITQLALNGDVPFSASAPLSMHANGSLDLKLTDALLAASGQRVRGQIVLNTDVSGSVSEPQVVGNLQLSQGEYMNYALGTRISKLNGRVTTDGQTGQKLQFEGKVGPSNGSLVIMGTSNFLAEKQPIDIKITARNAKVLSSDELTVDLNSDLTIHGRIQDRLETVGRITINRAEIRVPERMPPQIKVLKVRRYGEVTTKVKSEASSLNVGVDLTIAAPSQIFVRGRGIDAELGGTIKLKGNLDQLQPHGGFDMRRGTFTIAGKTLNFDKGQVLFDSGSLTDPSLAFAASSRSSSITAYLNVEGSARNPKITLSSSPDLPQDEVLTYLLFNRSSTTLGPMEMVQIASALASLTGIQTQDPLDMARKKLGLDRLSIGGSSSGSPTLEAGRYVAPGVFVGVKQGTSATQTQAAVQVDVAKGFKVEALVGTGASTNPSASSMGSGLGVIYEHEY